MTGISLKNALKNGERIYGTAIISPSPHWPDAVKQTGLDFVFLDTEHIALSRETLAQMCQVYSGLGLPSIVRIPSPDPYEACKILDGGATGILAPYIESVDQVKALVGALKLRPLKGKKLQSVLDEGEAIEPTLQKYIDARNENAILLINIKSAPALDNLDELLAVPGLDGVIIGPHDLSCSLGIPEEYQNPMFKDAVEKIIDGCLSAGLAVGIHLSESPQLQIDWAKAGVNIIMHSSDISIFSQALKSDVDIMRAALGDKGAAKEMQQKII